MYKNEIIISILFIYLVSLPGCAHFNGNKDSMHADLIAASRSVVDDLELNMGSNVYDGSIIVATFVDVNNLDHSSTFGRFMAEQVASELSNRGYEVVEIKLRNSSIFIEEGKGEFLLSRNVKEISQKNDASCVVVGIYADGYKQILLNVKMLDPNSNVIISSSSSSIKMNKDEQKKYLDKSISIEDIDPYS